MNLTHFISPLMVILYLIKFWHDGAHLVNINYWEFDFWNVFNCYFLSFLGGIFLHSCRRLLSRSNFCFRLERWEYYEPEISHYQRLRWLQLNHETQDKELSQLVSVLPNIKRGTELNGHLPITTPMLQKQLPKGRGFRERTSNVLWDAVT